MPTNFAKYFKRTGARVIVRQFGESIFYRAGGTAKVRPVKATIDRNPLSILQEIGSDVPVNSCIVRVANDAAGILSESLDSGGDQVLIAYREGGEPEWRAVAKLLSGANGFTRFLVT